MTFALVAEGISEHNIIIHIVERYFRDQSIFINTKQPDIEAGKQESGGGWDRVLKYCESEDLFDAVSENDYVIIQIDTDELQNSPLNINYLGKGGKIKSNIELYEDVLLKLQSLIKPEIFEAYKTKLIFAICIHTIECWFLPLFYSNNHKTDTKGCLTKLNFELRRLNLDTISTTGDKNNHQSKSAYKEAMSGWKRKSDIVKSSKHNVGFKKFVESLNTIPI